MGVFMHYKELKEKAEKADERNNAKANKGYNYARSLGFTSRESTLLQFKSTEEIDRIAKERDDGNGV
jgi:hypothetical protein